MQGTSFHGHFEISGEAILSLLRGTRLRELALLRESCEFRPAATAPDAAIGWADGSLHGLFRAVRDVAAAEPDRELKVGGKLPHAELLDLPSCIRRSPSHARHGTA